VETRIDQRRVDAFARRMAGQLNEAMLALLTSIAHQTGLFDAMGALPPATSQAIAAAAGLDERYVREWLGAMVTGRIVDYDGVRGTYYLPPEHAASLTRAAGASNLARRAPRVAALAQLEGALVERFRDGGGLPSASFARLEELDASEVVENASNLLAAFETDWPDLAAALDAGIEVLELRSGLRPAVSPVVERFHRSRWSVRDPSDCSAMPAQDLVITWEALAGHPDPEGLLGAIREALRPDGHLVCVEAAASSNLADNLDRTCAPLLYATSTMHSLPVSAAAGGTALGMMWGEERARQMLAATGFLPTGASPLGADSCRICLVARPCT